MRKFLFDLGTHNGDSVNWFYSNNGFYRKRGDNLSEYIIYCFEPNANHHNLEGKFAGNHNIKIIPKAAYTHNDGLVFKNAPDSLSSCVSKYSMQCYDESYATIEELESVDFCEFLKNVAVPSDYIIVKMDIESSEYDLIPHMLKNELFLWINEFYVEFHHTIEGWEDIKNDLCNKIKEQCPTIFFDPNWQ